MPAAGAVGSVADVRRVLLSPKWLLGHVLVLVAAAVFCRLGWWQWHRSRETNGNMQYLSYAVQWPLFAGFAVLLWVRIVRDSQRPPDRDEPARTPVRTPAAPAVPPPARPARTEDGGTEDSGDGQDDELAAYNRYLASLYERDRRETA